MSAYAIRYPEHERSGNTAEFKALLAGIEWVGVRVMRDGRADNLHAAEELYLDTSMEAISRLVS